MDIEHCLLSKILEEKDLGPAAEAGIKPDFFTRPEHRQVYSYLLDFKRDYGIVPTTAVVKRDFPGFERLNMRDYSYDWVIEEMRQARKHALLSTYLTSATTSWDQGDYDSALEQVNQMLLQISGELPTTRDFDITKTTADRWEKYLSLRDLPDGLRGIPTGFETIDRATQGLQKEQLITLVGPPKAGKSTVLLLLAMKAWAQGLKPLLFTFEMSYEEMTERLDAIRAGISHSRMRNGTLKKSEMELLQKTLHEIENMHSFIISADTNSATTLSGIAAKVDTYKPDILFIDGVYMLDDENGEQKGSWQALTNITRGAKRLAQNKEIPVVLTTQVLESKKDAKKGVTTTSIGYSSSFVQDSDTVIAVDKTDDPNVNVLKILAARNCPPLEKKVQWDWETATFEELAEDAFDFSEDDF